MHGVDYNYSSPWLVSLSVRTPVKMVALTSVLALPLSVAPGCHYLSFLTEETNIYDCEGNRANPSWLQEKSTQSVVHLWRVAFSHYVWKAAAWLLRPESHRQLPTWGLTDTSHVGSQCWIYNWLFCFNVFIINSSPKLICFNSRAIDKMTWSTP